MTTNQNQVTGVTLATGVTSATPGTQARRPSTIEIKPNLDIKELILGMKKEMNENMKVLDVKLDLMGNKIEQNSKIVLDLSVQIEKFSDKSKELDTERQELKMKSNKSDKALKKNQNECKEMKKSQEEMKEDLVELKNMQETMQLWHRRCNREN